MGGPVWLAPLALAAGAAGVLLSASARISLPAPVYAPLHLLLELVSVLVCAMVAAAGWHTLSRVPSLPLAAVVSAFAGVALLDLSHTLVFEGMPAFFGATGGGRAIAPFLVARLLAAAALLAVALMPHPVRMGRLAQWLLLAGSLALALGTVVAGQLWPDLRLLFMQPGVGLTPLKVGIEILLVALYLLAAGMLWRRARNGGTRALGLLAVAAGLMGLSELALAVYRTPTDLPNLVAHVLKVLAYLLVYRAVFVPMVVEPWMALDRAHAAIDAGEERWRMLFAHSLDALLVTTPDGQVVAANPAACALFGHSEAQLRAGGRSLVSDPADAERVGLLLAERNRLGRVTGEMRFRRADGSTFEAEVTSSLYTDTDGSRMASLLVRDVTGRKQRDREVLRLAQLEAANAELERFSYAVAHDLRAPLASVAGFATALAEDLQRQRSDRVNHFVDRIQANAQRMDTMIEGLLSLARLSRAEMQPREVDLGALARAHVAQLHEREPQRVVQLQVQDGLVARTDPWLAEVLLQNLLGNAWKFSARSPMTWIEVGAGTSAEGETVFHVRDRGAGFEMADAGRLFSVFQRLHSNQEFPGHGIGLANVKRVVERHGGRVWAEGRPGEGACFWFTLAPAPAAGDCPLKSGGRGLPG